MSIQEAKEHFKKRIAASATRWEALRNQLLQCNPKDDCFYMFSTNKGTPNEDRSRFMTYSEAMETVLYEIEKGKKEMNPKLITLCLGGGLFAILVFIHAVVDFIFQTHYEAMNKHSNAYIRARHCFTYTVGFMPILAVLCAWKALTFGEVIISTQILFWSHFIEDTYLPVYLWAKFIRRPPEMFQFENDEYGRLVRRDPKIGFIQFVNTTLGKILMIAVDQFIHFAFLFPIVYMALN